MPRLRKQQLLERIITATRSAGWSVTYSGTEHPFHLLIAGDNEVENLLVYIWNITHGGGAERPGHEYRIQITGVDSIDLVSGTKTLLLGYWDSNDMFAGWDATRHSGPVTGSSPSLQIREEYLRQAITDGLTVCPRGNDEVAVAFSPSSFVAYVRSLQGLHGAVSSAEQALIAQISRLGGQLDEVDIATLPLERQIIIRTVAERQRAASFRQQVLTAYKSRCAVCGIQLQLVDAAHIIPVKHSESNDEISNGICLCALHHRAYDQGLIAVMPDYRVMINRTKLSGLRSLDLGDGADVFERNLRQVILTPPNIGWHPHAALLSTAMRAREIEADHFQPPTDADAAEDDNE